MGHPKGAGLIARVLDASVALAWYLPDQATPLTEAVALHAPETGWRVPACFISEVVNVLLKQEQRRDIPLGVVEVMLADLQTLGVEVEPSPDVNEVVEAVALVRKHRISLFDAFYLALALRLRVQLVTRDALLATAAVREGCPVYELRASA